MKRINQVPGEVTFARANKDFFTGFLDFRGRTTRAGYWWVRLITVNICLMILRMVSFTTPFWQMDIFFLLVLGVPTIASETRRLRDVGFRGRGVFIYFGLMASLVLIDIFRFFSNDLLMFYRVFNRIGLKMIALTSIGMFFLTLLPSNFLETRSTNRVLTFFFREKKEVQETEEHEVPNS